MRTALILIKSIKEASFKKILTKGTKLKLVFSLIIFLLGINKFAIASDVRNEVNTKLRVQRLFLNKRETQRIYLVPGMAASVHMPCEIDEIVTPTNGIMKHISERNKTRFSLEVANHARPTNFIVHCVSSSYVFDLVVNNKIHNDLIEVDGDFGVPRLTQSPPLSGKPVFIFRKSDGALIGTTKNGETKNLEGYLEADAKEKINPKASEGSSQSPEMDYRTLPKTKIYDSSNKGDSDAY